MLIECTECKLPYYNFEDLEDHYELTHPHLFKQNNRLAVRVVKRLLDLHQKTYRCPHCFMPFPHPDLCNFHVEMDECDPQDDSDCEREEGLTAHGRRASVDVLVSKLKLRRRRRGSSTSTTTSHDQSTHPELR